MEGVSLFPEELPLAPEEPPLAPEKEKDEELPSAPLRRSTRKSASDAMKNIRAVIEWETCTTDSTLYRAVEQRINDEFERENRKRSRVSYSDYTDNVEDPKNTHTNGDESDEEYDIQDDDEEEVDDDDEDEDDEQTGSQGSFEVPDASDVMTDDDATTSAGEESFPSSLSSSQVSTPEGFSDSSAPSSPRRSWPPSTPNQHETCTVPTLPDYENLFPSSPS
jgi:hypothetical protein